MPLPSLLPRAKTFRPVGAKILVKRLTEKDRIGQIFLPEQRANVDMARGTVAAIGSTVEDVADGDTVLFPRQMGYNRVDLAGEMHEVIPMSSVFAVEPK